MFDTFPKNAKHLEKTKKRHTNKTVAHVGEVLLFLEVFHIFPKHTKNNLWLGGASLFLFFVFLFGFLNVFCI